MTIFVISKPKIASKVFFVAHLFVFKVCVVLFVSFFSVLFSFYFHYRSAFLLRGLCMYTMLGYFLIFWLQNLDRYQSLR